MRSLIRYVLILVIVAVSAALVACGGSQDSATETTSNGHIDTTTTQNSTGGTSSRSDEVRRDGSSIEGMLALVPDEDAMAEHLMVSRYSAAADAAGLESEGTPGEDDFETAWLAAVAGGASSVTAQPPEFAGGLRAEQLRGRLGFQPSDIVAEIQAGLAPSVVTIGTGRFDPAVVLDGADAVQGARRSEVSGVEVVGWLDDHEMDLTLDTPVGRPGQAGRLGLPTEDVVVHTSADAEMARVIDTIAGTAPSLADREPLRLVADHLDRHGAIAAVLSDLVPGNSDGAPTDGLGPYSAYGVGGAVSGHDSEVIIVLAHDDDAAARINAERLEDIVASGTDATSGRAWSDMLADPRIDTDGNVVVARFVGEMPAEWTQVFQARLSLLAMG